MSGVEAVLLLSCCTVDQNELNSNFVNHIVVELNREHGRFHPAGLRVDSDALDLDLLYY